MGCLFSKSDTDEYEEKLLLQQHKPRFVSEERAPPPRASTPRDSELGQPAVPNFLRKSGGGASIGGGDAPVFSSLRGAATAAAPTRQQSSVFCPCGGPGARVKLLPCGHSALCLSCAQMEPACPACGEVVRDSVPSFRAAK